ncbi:mechanosensitive ion channel family protein [Maricaulis sp. CAU 1757]
MTELLSAIPELPLGWRLLAIVGIAAAVHLLVRLIRFLAWFTAGRFPERRHQKLRSVTSLAASIGVFTLYFLTIGFILQQLGVSLTAYLASATVIGLAIGFGSQGLVQDVVNGLTFIFSDLLDVGDLVEISGQTGIVRAITMRFVVLENALGAKVLIPNRTVNNVINYPRSYVRCIVDVTLPGDAEQRDAGERTALRLMQGFHEQFPGIFLSRPSKEARITLSSGREILRMKFRIWPGRGDPIKDIYLNEVVAEFSADHPDYKPWMVAISFESENRPDVVKPELKLNWPKREKR